MYNIFILFISTLSFFSCFNFIQNDGYNRLLLKYKKWQKLNKLVSTTHNSVIIIKLVSISMIFKSYYLSFIQYINNSVKKLDKNTYEVSYVINGKLYKMVVRPSRGPAPILSVKNEHEINIIDDILPYLGPNNDWFNKKYNPRFFNHDVLKFELSSGEIKIFKETEYITLD